MAVALIFASAACSSANRDVAIRSVNSEAVGTAGQDSLARGDLLFSRGEHALALDAYRRAMRQNPADPHALKGGMTWRANISNWLWRARRRMSAFIGTSRAA
jgi:tetratricopeptide (TPR) repeat protein